MIAPLPSLDQVRAIMIALLPPRSGRRTLADWLATLDVQEAWGEAMRSRGGAPA